MVERELPLQGTYAAEWLEDGTLGINLSPGKEEPPAPPPFIPLYSQREPEWADVRLGTGSVSIGGYGCVITCLAMLLTYHGFPETPMSVNEKLIQHHGFHDGSYFIWESVIRIWPPLHLTRKVNCPLIAAPIEAIDAELEAGRLPIVYLDFDHDTSNGLQTHFVLVVGKNGERSYWVHDPWTGKKVDLVEAYGEVDPRTEWMEFHHGIIVGARFYSQ